jgi:chromosome segregation ATPase
MQKLSVSLAITAFGFGILGGATACERNEIEREAKDVKDAREDLNEEQRELGEEDRKQTEKHQEKIEDEQKDVDKADAEVREEQAELTNAVRDQITDLDKRYNLLDEEATTMTKSLQAKGIGTSTGVGAEIENARTTAKLKIDAARTATTAESADMAIKEAEDALDELRKTLDSNKGKV